MIGEGAEGFVGKPGRLAELPCRAQPEWCCLRQKAAEQGRVGREIGRQLKKDGAEAAGLSKGTESGGKAGQGFAEIAQAAQMGDALRSFERKAEVSRRLSQPVSSYIRGWQ